MTEHMALVSINTLTERFTKVIGLMIFKVDMVLKNGLTSRFFKENIKKERNKDLVFIKVI